MGNAECGMRNAQNAAGEGATEKLSDLRERTKLYALSLMKLSDSLPRARSAGIIARQLIRSATSVGANYRAACRARSKAEFISKMGIVEEEADECLYWLELIAGAGYANDKVIRPLAREGNELVSIVVASIKTARDGAK